jgi:hypothetical protein
MPDAMREASLLFVREDPVEMSWAIVQRLSTGRRNRDQNGSLGTQAARISERGDSWPRTENSPNEGALSRKQYMRDTVMSCPLSELLPQQHLACCAHRYEVKSQPNESVCR